MREDLFAIIDAAGELLNTPILLEDTEFRVLAWSKGQHAADEERVSGILDRHAQPWLIDVLKARGVISRLINSPEPIFVGPASPQAKPRMACRVQHGGRHLGYLWASAETPFDHRQRTEFFTAAESIANRMTQADGHTVDLAASRADLEAVLLGTSAADGAAARLGFLSMKASVVAAASSLRPQSGSADDVRPADAFGLYLTTTHPRFKIGNFHQVTYAVLLWPKKVDDAEARAHCRKIAEGFQNRSGLREKITLAISETVGDPHQIRLAKSQVDRILTVQRENTKAPSIAFFEDVQLTYALTQLRRILRQDGTVLGGHIPLLEDHDRQNKTDFVSTLRCYLDSFGDVNSASAKIHLHPNTFRYRLRRIREISGFDPQDPDMRCLAELQLRMRELG